MKKILNLTQHNATPEQVAQGVVEPSPTNKARIIELLTFDDIPDYAQIAERARELGKIVWDEFGIMDDNDAQSDDKPDCLAMIGGAPYLMPELHFVLATEFYTTPLFAFSKRVSEEKVNPDGSVTKTQVFKHLGFV